MGSIDVQQCATSLLSVAHTIDVLRDKGKFARQRRE
jgi:hypothetical protein